MREIFLQRTLSFRQIDARDSSEVTKLVERRHVIRIERHCSFELLCGCFVVLQMRIDER